MRIPEYENPVQWIRKMCEADLSYHPDDSAADIVNCNGRVFTDEEAELADKYMGQIFTDLRHYGADPYMLFMFFDGYYQTALMHATTEEDALHYTQDLIKIGMAIEAFDS